MGRSHELGDSLELALPRKPATSLLRHGLAKETRQKADFLGDFSTQRHRDGCRPSCRSDGYRGCPRRADQARGWCRRYLFGRHRGVRRCRLDPVARHGRQGGGEQPIRPRNSRSSRRWSCRPSSRTCCPRTPKASTAPASPATCGNRSSPSASPTSWPSAAASASPNRCLPTTIWTASARCRSARFQTDRKRPRSISKPVCPPRSSRNCSARPPGR